jgi:hypothetical protein
MPADALAEPAYCHAVLARLVEDPGRLTSDPDHDQAWPGLDVQRLRQITGFITKVRHNPVRFRLPLTMRALAAAGIEIDSFADLAPEFSTRRRQGLSDEERTALFVAALERWLQPSDDVHRLVADVLAHELTMLELAGHDPVPPPAVDAVVDGDSRPRVRAGVRILHLTVHPPDVADVSRDGVLPSDVDRAPRCYAYIPTPAGPRVKSVEPAIVPLLELADGSSSIAEIATALDIESAAEGLAAVFEVLVRRGLADIEVR